MHPSSVPWVCKPYHLSERSTGQERTRMLPTEPDEKTWGHGGLLCCRLPQTPSRPKSGPPPAWDYLSRANTNLKSLLHKQQGEALAVWVGTGVVATVWNEGREASVVFVCLRLSCGHFSTSGGDCQNCFVKKAFCVTVLKKKNKASYQ